MGDTFETIPTWKELPGEKCHYGYEYFIVKVDYDSSYEDWYTGEGYHHTVNALRAFNADSWKIHIFENKENGRSICSLWDGYENLYQFICKSKYSQFECVRELICMVKDITTIEKNVF